MSRMPSSYAIELQSLVEMISYQNEEEAFAYTQSPIEGIFATAFMTMGHLLFGKVAIHEPGCELLSAPRQFGFILKCQVPIGRYRADFVASANPSRSTARVIVECDGHNFHERTKEQAAYDRARDRELQASGYKVFRFTGSELYRNALGCAQEVFEEIERQLREEASS